MQIVIKKKVMLPTPAERARFFTGPRLDIMLEQNAEDLGDQVRANIIKHGEPGGDWPQLSGFNGARDHKKARAAEVRGERDRMLSPKDFKDAGRPLDRLGARTLRKRRGKLNHELRKILDRQLVSKHTGYARTKERELGRSMAFGPGVRLRATGKLFAQVIGKITKLSNGNVRIELDAGDRTKILYHHIHGDGNNPVRNPADKKDMRPFERRVLMRWRGFLDEAAAYFSTWGKNEKAKKPSER